METQIKVTHTGSYSAKFEHDDVSYRIDWEDDSQTIYFYEDYGMECRRCVSIPLEILPTLTHIFQVIERANLIKQGKNG